MVAKFDVTLDMSAWKSLESELGYLDSREIEYGYLKPTMHPEAEVPVTNIAMWNHSGVKAKEGNKWRIPPRPFMTIASVVLESMIDKYNRRVAQSLGEGSASMNKALDFIAKEAADTVRTAISEGDYKALSPSTIRQKNSDTILIESGFMFDAAEGDVINRTGD